MQSNFPKTPIVISIIFLLCSVAALFFSYRAIQNNDRKTREATIEWQREATKRDEIRQLDNSVKLIQEEKIELESHFAKSSNIVPFLDTLEKLAMSAGDVAEVVSVNILEDGSGLVVGITVSGSFANIYKFITLLENSQYALEFITSDIRKENAAASKWDALFSIKLLSFVK